MFQSNSIITKNYWNHHIKGPNKLHKTINGNNGDNKINYNKINQILNSNNNYFYNSNNINHNNRIYNINNNNSSNNNNNINNNNNNNNNKEIFKINSKSLKIA